MESAHTDNNKKQKTNELASFRVAVAFLSLSLVLISSCKYEALEIIMVYTPATGRIETTTRAPNEVRINFVAIFRNESTFDKKSKNSKNLYFTKKNINDLIERKLVHFDRLLTHQPISFSIIHISYTLLVVWLAPQTARNHPTQCKYLMIIIKLCDLRYSRNDLVSDSFRSIT